MYSMHQKQNVYKSFIVLFTCFSFLLHATGVGDEFPSFPAWFRTLKSSISRGEGAGCFTFRHLSFQLWACGFTDQQAEDVMTASIYFFCLQMSSVPSGHFLTQNIFNLIEIYENYPNFFLALINT